MSRARTVDVDEFLDLDLPILDVRSPIEFARGHVPGAVSMPLFTDDERALVGTTYRERGNDEAVRVGLELVGPKLSELVEFADEIVSGAGRERAVRLHCWRGGMRSNAVAWLLGLAGFTTARLAGGYKAFRHWALEALDAPRQLVVLGGLTGSGKTELLHGLRDAGEQTVDLEGDARHRGSVFGGLGETEFPTQAQFENRLAVSMRRHDRRQPTWIEDESRQVGVCHVPEGLWLQMQDAPRIVAEVPRHERLTRAVADYGQHSPAALTECVERLSRRLGDVRHRTITGAIESGDLTTAADCLLEYYDSKYRHGLARRPDRSRIVVALSGDLMQRAAALRTALSRSGAA